MLSIAICHAVADAALVRALMEYLRLNLDLKLEAVPVSPWLDLLESVETALAADHVIAVLSPGALPERLPRERWDAITDPRIGWALAGDCPYPPLLARRCFFDLRENAAAGFRQLQRWLMSGQSARPVAPALEPYFQALVDRPGSATIADLAVLAAVRSYFVWEVNVDTRERTEASLVGEVAAQLDLDRSADLETMVAAVRQMFRERRCLVVWKGEDPGLTDEAGRSSVVRIPVDEPAVRIAPEEMIRLLTACQRGHAEPPSRADLDRTLAHAFAAVNWPVTRELGLVAYSYLKAEYRLAEAYGLLDSLKKGAEFYADDPVIGECRQELSWIADRWAYGATSGCELSPQLGFDW